ncbi:MAG: hypothetical protein P8Y18_05725 [Candidatus Bathyarchaeota archaeon]
MKIIRIVVKLIDASGIIKKAAIMFVISNVNPLENPRFSTEVQSVNKAKHEGIPKPNEDPRSIAMVNMFGIVKLLTNQILLLKNNKLTKS